MKSDFQVPSNATILDAAERIQRNEERAVFVVEGERVVGIVSQGDILRALLRGTNVRAPLSNIVNPTFRFMTEQDPAKAFDLIKRHNISVIPVVDSKFKLLEVYSLGDMLDSLSFDLP